MNKLEIRKIVMQNMFHNGEYAYQVRRYVLVKALQEKTMKPKTFQKQELRPLEPTTEEIIEFKK